MASEIKVTLHKADISEREGSEPPVHDLSNAAVKELIRTAEKRGYVAHDQINALLASEEINSEQVEDILANLSEMGVNVVETKEPRLEEELTHHEEPDEKEDTEGENELAEIRQHAVPAKSGAKVPAERTDDPVRMYLREMTSVNLLSREGEIAIAKRIEAGREAMIASLCESPLTFQAITVWRDELNDGKVLLRDVIDLDATGPDAKALPTPEIDTNGQMIASFAIPHKSAPNRLHGVAGAAAAAERAGDAPKAKLYREKLVQLAAADSDRPELLAAKQLQRGN
jgi:RNA polymerase primary sigma factor